MQKCHIFPEIFSKKFFRQYHTELVRCCLKQKSTLSDEKEPIID